MTTPALLIEELVNATGFSRQTVKEVIDTIVETIADKSTHIQQRISGIMTKQSSLDARFDEVVELSDDYLDRHIKSRIAGALGFGLLGGLLLSGATTIIVELVGIVLILLAGYMIYDLIRLAMNRLNKMIEDFSI